MNVAPIVTASRGLQESVMTDACTIVRPGDDPGEYDADSDTFTAPSGTTVYSGKCRVRLSTPAVDRGVEVGANQFAAAAVVVTIPADSTGVALDDVVTVTAPAQSEPLAGCRFRVTAIQRASHATAVRLGCEELTP